MKISKWLIAVIAVMLVVALTGCGGASNEDGNSDVTGNQQKNTDPQQTLDAEIGLVDGSIFEDEDIAETMSQNPITPETTEPDVTLPVVTRPEHLNPDEDVQKDPGQPEQDPSEPVTAKPTTPPATEPPVTDTGELTYEQFRDLTPSQQQAYQETFESIEAFFEWYNAAKDAYDEANPPILIGPDGVVDLNKIP